MFKLTQFICSLAVLMIAGSVYANEAIDLTVTINTKGLPGPEQNAYVTLYDGSKDSGLTVLTDGAGTRVEDIQINLPQVTPLHRQIVLGNPSPPVYATVKFDPEGLPHFTSSCFENGKVPLQFNAQDLDNWQFSRPTCPH